MTDDTRVQAGAPLALKAGPGAAGILPDDLAWEMQPHAYWHHAVAARPEARILVTAGGQPVLTAWEVGAGRVAALAVTAEGDPGADELPFWEWGDMPRLLASVCTWLLSAPRPAKTYTVDAESRRQLEQLAVASPTDDQEQRQRQLTTLLMRCREPAFAREIIEAVEASPATPDRPFTDAVWGAVRPHIDGTFAAAADALIASRDPGKADLGLRVLGQARPPKAASRLKHFLEHGLDGFEAGTGADLFAEDTTLPVTTAGDIAANERLRLAAVCALGELGDAASLDALRAVTREFSGKRQQLSEVTDLPDLNEGLYQQSLGARCRLGDADAAVPYLDVIAHNADDIEQFQNALDEMLVTKDDKRLLHMRKLAGMRLPGLHRRQALCMQTLRQSPYAVGAACARELAKRDDPRLAPFAFAALCPAPARPPDPAVRDSLLALVRDCPTPEVRLLAFRVCRSNPDAEAGRLAAALLPELATAESAAGARFALRRVPQLPTSERAAVIAAGLRHADPGVSRLARLSLALLPAGQRQAVEEAAGAAAKAE